MWKFPCKCMLVLAHDKIYTICLIKVFQTLKILKTHVSIQQKWKNLTRKLTFQRNKIQKKEI